MENTLLKEKINKSKHLFNHPTNDAERFLDFLKTQGWDQGLLIELECHRGHSMNYFRRNNLNCVGIHTDTEWHQRATQLYPLTNYRLKDDYYPDHDQRMASAVFGINPLNCSYQEALNCVEMILKPGGYLFMHFAVKNIPDSEKVIRSCVEEGYDIIRELKFARLRFDPITYFHSIYEVFCQKKIR